jgi:uncharacterized lipoprotein YajG
MKRKMLALVLTVLMTVSLLTGCGSSAMMDNAAPQEVYAEMEEAKGLYGSANGSVTTSSAQSTDQKMIKRVTMNVETENLSELLDHINEKITQLNGYMEEQQLNNGSAYSSHRSRSANLTVRIPADQLDGFVEQVKGLSNVTSYNQSTENVTLSYVATESRMKALQTEEERLLELLSKAENMSDLLKIEARLTEVRYELEKTTSQLRVLQNQVDYATVRLYITQVTVFTEVEPLTVWQRIGTGFRSNLKDIGEDLVDFFVWAVTYSPQLMLLAATVTVVVLLTKRSLKKQKQDRAAKNEEEE